MNKTETILLFQKLILEQEQLKESNGFSIISSEFSLE